MVDQTLLATADEFLPLSYEQERLWFLSQLRPEGTEYNIPGAVRLVGVLDLATVERSLAAIAARHEVLRTTFEMQDGQPFQVIHPAQEFSLPLIDLRDTAEPDRAAREWLIQEALRPFDLATGPLWRASVLRVGKEDHVLSLSMHHIISDGWSIGVFVGEFVTLYETAVRGQEAVLPALPVQYADYALWQRDWLQGRVLTRHVDYWRSQLAELPTLQLPTDHARPAVQSTCGAGLNWELSQELLADLKMLSNEQGSTLFMTLLAAFQVLLSRYSGQTDIAVGSPIANRTRNELEGLIGFFVNTLVLRSHWSGDVRFVDLLAQVREVCLGAYAHQDLPFEKLVAELQPVRDMSRSPLFQVMFVLQNTPQSDLHLPDLRVVGFQIDTTTAQFDLTLFMTETPQGLSASLEYNTDLFDAETIVRMAEHFQTLLAGIVADPQRRLSELPMLSERERQQLLVEWNATQTDYPQQLCIHQLFEQQVERTPEAVAVVFEDQQLTYSQLNARANQLAHHLRDFGVGPEVIVGLCVERSLEMVVGLLGILKAGGAYLPLDPTYPAERLAFMLEDAQASSLLTQEHLAVEAPLVQGQIVLLDADWPVIARCSSDNPTTAVQPHHLAYVIYTSGSTGKPKGVMIQHEGVTNLVNAQITTFALQPHSRVLQFASLSFDASVLEVFMTLCSGAALCLAPSWALLPGPHLEKTLSTLAISVMALVPSALAALTPLTLPSLEVIISGGEICPAPILANWSINRRFFNEYGPTEASVCATIALHTDSQEVLSIGRPIANKQVYILDSSLQPVPIGVAGELYIGGAGLARGYLRRPDLTAERFIPHPFSDAAGARLYRTGDLARYLGDGNIEYLGRIDQQVKIRGFRIELGEIEARLQQHPAVREAAVLAREDSPGDNRLVAYLACKEREDAPGVSELRAFLGQTLPQHMLPSSFVVMERLPLTPNGKLDRRALPAPEAGREQLEIAYVAPRNALEQAVADLWGQVLRREQIGVHDNFFELGGHSLLATRLIARLQSQLDIQLPLRALLERPTIAGITETMSNVEDKGKWYWMEKIRYEGENSDILIPLAVQSTAITAPPLFCIHPVGGVATNYIELANYLAPNHAVYGIQSVGLDGRELPLKTIEEISEKYTQAIRTIQPHGPYRLVGYSLGGIISFEMAQQLQKQNEDVELLALVDTTPETESTDDEDMLSRWLSIIDLHLGTTIAPLLDERIEDEDKTIDERLDQILARAVERQLLPDIYQPQMARNLFNVFKSNQEAGVQYMPHLYQGKIVLLYTQANEVRLTTAWKQISSEMDAYSVPGDHTTVLMEPNVKAVADILNSYLEGTNGRRKE